jgi:hypothetical protein
MILPSTPRSRARNGRPQKIPNQFKATPGGRMHCRRAARSTRFIGPQYSPPHKPNRHAGDNFNTLIINANVISSKNKQRSKNRYGQFT